MLVGRWNFPFKMVPFRVTCEFSRANLLITIAYTINFCSDIQRYTMIATYSFFLACSLWIDLLRKMLAFFFLSGKIRPGKLTWSPQKNQWLEDVFPIEIVQFSGDIFSFSGEYQMGNPPFEDVSPTKNGENSIAMLVYQRVSFIHQKKNSILFRCMIRMPWSWICTPWNMYRDPNGGPNRGGVRPPKNTVWNRWVGWWWMGWWLRLMIGR